MRRTTVSRSSRLLLLALPVVALAAALTRSPPTRGAPPPADAMPGVAALPADVPPVRAEPSPGESPRLPLTADARDLGKKIDSYFEERPGRRVYVQVDRPLYRPGETVWVKSWDLRVRDLGAAADAGAPGAAACELVSPRGAVVTRREVSAEGGFAATELDLAADLPGGEYTIRVHAAGGERGERTLIVAGYEQPRMKMKLELTRKAYGAGDPVEAAFELRRPTGQALPGHPVRAVARVDGVELPTVKVTTDARGDAKVRFRLPAAISSGDALLTVLVDDGGTTESISRRIPVVVKALDLALRPEGGELVEEVPSRVYFEAQDPFGKPADVEGHVEDDRGEVVARFRSHKNGLGRFVLRPVRDRRYAAVVTAPVEARSRHALPAARGEGCVLRAYDDLDGEVAALRVGVRCSRPRAVTVVAVQRDQLIDAARVAVAVGAEAVVHLRARGAAAGLSRAQGVARITVFGEQLEPLAERLVYRNRRQRLTIGLHPDRPSYGPRDGVALTVRTTGPDGRPVAAEVALSVVDDTVIAYADDKQGHLLSQLLLEPELAGRVEEPNVYLDLTKPESALALDLLLGTRGWRRFEWQPVMAHDPVARAAELRRQAEERRREELAQRREEAERRREEIRAAREEREHRRMPKAKAGAILRLLGGAAGAGRADGDRLGLGGGAIAEGRMGGAGLGAGRGAPRPERVGALAPKEPRRPAAAPRLPPAPGPAQQALGPRAAERPVADADAAAAAKELLPRARRLVRVQAAHIQILDKVYFASKSAAIRPASYPILDAVAAVLRDHPQIRLLEVQGHGDAVEAKDAPTLAARRAHAVVAYLVRKGVPRERLRPRGYGAHRPIASNATVAGRDRNRRVEWLIQQRDEPGLAVARVFPVPDYRGQPSGPRTDFRDTVYWAPRVRTGADGRAQVRFTLSDAVTSFRVVAEGVATRAWRHGLVGRGEKVFRSDRPLSLSARLPLEVSAGDEVLVPVTLTNERGEPVEARLQVEHDQLLAAAGALPAERRRLAPRARDTTYVPLRVVGQRGQAHLKVSASAGGYADEVARELAVTPVGFPLVASRAGNVGGRGGVPVREAVDVGQVVPGSVLAQVQLYPSPVATMVGGLEGLLREPSGCFEQASSSNYPNVMIASYLRQHRVHDEQLLGRANRLLDSGYRRLTGFESRSKGYEWFGADPAHEALTAFGLVQFLDMKRVYAVDDPMVARTVAWLKSRRDGQGGFQRHTRALDTFGRASPEVTNAYIVYALSEAGQLDGGMAPEVAAQRRLAQTTRDPYLLALAANTLLNVPAHLQEGVTTTGRLAALQARAGAEAGAFPGADHSITRSSGTNLLIETTALALIAMVKAGRLAEAQAAVAWLQRNRGGFGQWGATQATVLALKALTRHAEATARAPAPGAVEVRLNGASLGRVAFEAGRREPILFAAGEHFRPGANQLEIVGEGQEPLPYSVAVEYRSRQPASSATAPVALRAALARGEARLGDAVRVDVTVTNREAKGQPMVLARIGLPGGLTFQTWQLKELRERGQIAFYETRPREVILYFRQLLPREEKRLALELQATVPGRYTGPASSAYLYYGDDQKSWAAPLEIRIAP
ncbi:MAG TPA: MG2 domain-containing protein [Polyangia bacterium]